MGGYGYFLELQIDQVDRSKLGDLGGGHASCKKNLKKMSSAMA